MFDDGMFDEVYSTTTRLKVTDKEVYDNLIVNLIKSRSLSPFLRELLNAYYYEDVVRKGVDAYIERVNVEQIEGLVFRLSETIKQTDSTRIDAANLRVVARKGLQHGGVASSLAENEAGVSVGDYRALEQKFEQLQQAVESLLKLPMTPNVDSEHQLSVTSVDSPNSNRSVGVTYDKTEVKPVNLAVEGKSSKDTSKLLALLNTQ